MAVAWGRMGARVADGAMAHVQPGSLGSQGQHTDLSVGRGDNLARRGGYVTHAGGRGAV